MDVQPQPQLQARRQAPQPNKGAALRFLTGWWLNRRYTRLWSSIVLALIAPAALIAAAISVGGTLSPGIITFLCVSAVFYPTAREGYYRVTQPIRDASRGLWFFGLLAILAYVVKLWIYVILFALSVPIGILSGLALGFAEVGGRGWRVL